MIPYFGRHGCKQYIRGKPVRFGFKAWSLNTPLGYQLSFEIYQGTNPRIPKEYSVVGLNAAPLLYFIDTLPPTIRDLPYHFYFDNLFTCLPLLYWLDFHGYGGTGTIRANRFPDVQPFRGKAAQIKRLKKGKIQRNHSTSGKIKWTGCQFRITQWIDNSAVCVASTRYGKLPEDEASRFSRTDRARVTIPRPYAIQRYNMYMGGTDRMDQNVADRRIGLRQQKWWWAIFIWCIDVTVQNAWLLYRLANGSSMGQAQFREQIAKDLCKFGRPKYAPRMTNVAPAAAYERRFDNSLQHLVHHTAINTNNMRVKRTCAMGSACANKNVSRTSLQCSACDVGLCIPCFYAYHQKPE